MAFTSADLAAIDAAIASGELSVTSNGRTVTYRSMNDLKQARQIILNELASQRSGVQGGAYRFTFKTMRED